MHLRLSRILLIFWALTFCIALLPSIYASTETLRPNAVGDSAQCTQVGGSGPNWDCVDETPHDSDTSYVRSVNDEVACLDLYNIQDTAIPVGSTINSVTVYAVIRSTNNAYTADFRIALKKSGGSTQYGTGENPTTTYTLKSAVFSGIAQTNLNALQIGIEITSYLQKTTYYHGRCTQVYVVIDYTEVTATWNIVSTWSNFLVTRSWQASGTWSEFLVTRSWLTSASWSNYLISRAWQNVASLSVSLITMGWHTVAAWSILLLGEDPTTIVIILFLFSVVAFTGLGLYRKRKKN